MFRPALVPCLAAVWLSLAVLAGLAPSVAPAQDLAGRPRQRSPGQFFPIAEPITHETIARFGRPLPARRPQRVGRAGEPSDPGLRVRPGRHGARAPAIRRLLRPGEPDLQGAGGGQADGRLRAAAAQGLCGLAGGGLHRDRAWGRRHRWGRSRPEGQTVDAALREPVRFLAIRKTRDPDLLLGMLDRDADLRLVRTADKAVHYVLAENMKTSQRRTR